MNSLTYLEWMKHLPKDDGGYSSCECPACGKKGLSYQYFGFGNGDVGWKVIWCEACQSGVKISRTKVPQGVTKLIDFQEQERFFETKPELKLIF